MKAFDYARPAGVEEARELAAAPGSVLLGGGTDLVPRLKAWLLPEGEGERLVSLRDVPSLAVIEETEEGGLRIGGGVTLTALLEDERVASRAPILAEAARDAATPQLRNRATVAGNLLQRSRCPYYRTPDAFPDCFLKGGGGCPAREGDSRFAGIFGSGTCRSAHPSDLAPALLALGARLEVRTAEGTEERELTGLFAEPTEERRHAHTLEPGTLVTGLRLPPEALGEPQAYRKGMERAAWSFALASVALVLALDGDEMVRARVWLGGVAPIPWRAEACERALTGASLEDEAAWTAAGEGLVQGAEPLARNGYKLRLLKGLLRDAREGVLPRG